MPLIRTGSQGPENSQPQTIQDLGKLLKARSPRDSWITLLDCECVRETEKALLIWLKDADDPCWIPKSQMSRTSEIQQAGQKGKLVISVWIAEQKGLIDSIKKQAEKPPEAKPSELTEPYKLYRQLARKYHPDANPEPWAGQVMSDLTSLWHEVLKAKKG